jgi:protein-L-isoaspartate(D-aspartate) O-methyltransferase
LPQTKAQERDRDSELAVIRRAFAKQILAEAEIDDPNIEAAYASIRREDFLGPGPWKTIGGWTDEYVSTPTADPLYLYVDRVFAILPQRHLNNGQPSGHAKWIASATIKPGEHVVHVGTGTGYYTAIMANLVGSSGKVTGIEFDPDLAARATRNLASLANVRVIHGDGVTAPFDVADVIYVNAGVTRPADIWLDRLAEGGRLILPLTSNKGFMHSDPPVPISRRGAFFRIERRTSEFYATWISPVAIIPCESGRDEISEAALAEAFVTGGWKDVTRLWRHIDIPKDRCWLRAPGWCLAYH